MEAQTTCVIPILLGGSRLPNKNLLMLDGQPLLHYTLDIVRKASIFNKVIVYYEDPIIESVVNAYPFPVDGLSLVKRDPSRGGSHCSMKTSSGICNNHRCQIHDHYLYDLACTESSQYLFQLHTTSPLLSPSTVQYFVNQFIASRMHSGFLTTESKKEALYQKSPLNFSHSGKIPTQDLEAVNSIFWGLCGWKREELASALGSTHKASTFLEPCFYSELPPSEAVDIDTLEEFRLAEYIAKGRRIADITKPLTYFSESILSIERDLQVLLEKDGSPVVNSSRSSTLRKISIEDILDQRESVEFSFPISLYGQNQYCLIRQLPGSGCRYHYHSEHEEVWVVMSGRFLWYTPEATAEAGWGDIIILPAGIPHIITCVSDEPGIRLAIGSKYMDHIYLTQS